MRITSGRAGLENCRRPRLWRQADLVMPPAPYQASPFTCLHRSCSFSLCNKDNSSYHYLSAYDAPSTTFEVNIILPFTQMKKVDFTELKKVTQGNSTSKSQYSNSGLSLKPMLYSEHPFLSLACSRNS